MTEKQCPACMMVIDIDATVCPHCTKKFGLTPTAKILISLAVIWAIGFSSSYSVNPNTGSRTDSSMPSVEGNKINNMEETVRVGDTSYVAWKAWWSDRIGNNAYINDRATDSFLFVEVTVVNGDERTRAIPPFKLVDEKGTEYKTTIKSWLAENSIGIIDELNPGAGKTGVIVFDVPKDHDYTLKLSGGYFSDENALIAIAAEEDEGILLANQSQRP
jgi:hypothetical protein